MNETQNLTVLTGLENKVLSLEEEINKIKSKLQFDTVEESLDIKINYHLDIYPGLEPAEKHGNFFDLRAAKTVDLYAGKQALIPLGVSIYLPDGYYAELLPRSSTFKNYGFIIANSMGIIDTDYRSMKDIWMLSVYPTRNATVYFNDRIAQFSIVKEIPFTLTEGNWEAKERGGFGKSGVK